MKPYRVQLISANQYGPEGPQFGAKGRVVEERNAPDGGLLLCVEFDDFEGFAWANDWMVEPL